jgi:hypothetical protein
MIKNSLDFNSYSNKLRRKKYIKNRLNKKKSKEKRKLSIRVRTKKMRYCLENIQNWGRNLRIGELQLQILINKQIKITAFVYLLYMKTKDISRILSNKILKLNK